MAKQNKVTIQQWVLNHIAMFFLYNVIIMILVLMHSVGYFNPFFTISVNVIIMVAIILAVVLLRLSSRFVFACMLFFWVVSCFFQLTHINIWAERAGIYTYESMLVGVFVLFIEVVRENMARYSKPVKN